MTACRVLTTTLMLVSLMRPPAASADTPGFVLCCAPENDLYRTLTDSQVKCERYDGASEAVKAASVGGGVLLLAHQYPDRPTPVAASVFASARAKGLRVYVEYPASLPDRQIASPRVAHWERVAVCSSFFGDELPEGRILSAHECHFVPVSPPPAAVHLSLARIAGFNEAVYGLPAESWPTVFEDPKHGLLVATTKLSQFITARYAPAAAWQTVWHRILRWVCPEAGEFSLNWRASVRPTYGPAEVLGADVQRQAVARGAAWFSRSGLLAASSAPGEVVSFQKAAERLPEGDGSHGIQEGYSSRIRADGSQPKATVKRGDCNAEAAMGLAVAARISGDGNLSTTAGNILDYWYFESIAQKRQRAQATHPAFGLVSWGISSWAWEKAFYGDDNARLLLGSMATAALLDVDRWDEAMLKCLLANLRTTGRYGFRANRIDQPDLEANGWQHYFEGFTISYAPHYQAYLWACYLWAYRQTGYEQFLTKAQTAIRMTMQAYPDQWRWTNGIAQEKARMLLPLAWLVQVDDTAEHRAWLRRIGEDLLALQAPCGAIAEQLGPPETGAYGPPRSNEDYGKHEATLMQANGDPLCDLLYTTNFAFIGLHEAARATGEELYSRAEDRLAEFLCRIQIKSERHPELDGGWFRAFEFNNWEYWGSNADAGWGVWSIESGWTQGWIVATLGLRQMDTSLWELTAASTVKRHFEDLFPVMFPEGDAMKEPPLAEHLAVGKPVALETPPAPQYPGGGPGGLTDGILGVADHRHPAWTGLQGPDLVATIDLGEPMDIKSVSSRYLQSVTVGVFLPTQVSYAVSDDGARFRALRSIANDKPPEEAGPFVGSFTAQLKGVRARYLRVTARSIATIPDWHDARGRKAWLFADEIIVE